jgi:hypothetical protein
MRPGGGKQKGAQFEREVCKRLSLWVSEGKDEDLFWRSAMSGGRATVAGKSGKKLNRQAGDISAVSKEGCSLTDRFYIECKHVANLSLEGMLLNDNGLLASFWDECTNQAREYKKAPMLIARQNRWRSALVLAFSDDFQRLTPHPGMLLTKWSGKYCPSFILFDVLTIQPYLKKDRP